MRFKDLSIIVAALVISFVVWVLPGQTTVMGVYPGDLIKLQNDHDPATHEDEVVYYFDKDWYRRPFPNRKVFLSWYKDFSGVKELTREEMAEIRLGGSVVYRPGTRLVKIPSVPKVYAVEPGGVLRWIESEAVALALYGPDWAKRVDDLSESFFVNYREGAPLVSPVWPTGTVVRRASDDSLFLIDGPERRHLAPAAADGYRLNDDFVIRTASDLEDYASAAAVDPGWGRYVDTAQIDRIETLPPPQMDFPANLDAAEAGREASLYVFRVTAGQPIIIKRLGVTVSGPLRYGGAPSLTDLKFVDVAGVNLFGTKQLEGADPAEESLVWNGAYTMEANTTSLIELRAKIAPGLPAGSSFTVALDRDQVGLNDGKSGQQILDFYPRSNNPVTTVTVE